MIENKGPKIGEHLIEKFLPYQIDYTANFNKSFRREFQLKFIGDDISADEFGILHILFDNSHTSQTELAKFLFKGKAHVGKILNEMEEKGLITRGVDVRNNIMIKKNELTPKGLDYLNCGLEKSKIIENKMNSEFSTEEIEHFISYLIRFRNVLGSIVDVKLK